MTIIIILWDLYPKFRCFFFIFQGENKGKFSEGMWVFYVPLLTLPQRDSFNYYEHNYFVE